MSNCEKDFDQVRVKANEMVDRHVKGFENALEDFNKGIDVKD